MCVSVCKCVCVCTCVCVCVCVCAIDTGPFMLPCFSHSNPKEDIGNNEVDCPRLSFPPEERGCVVSCASGGLCCVVCVRWAVLCRVRQVARSEITLDTYSVNEVFRYKCFSAECTSAYTCHMHAVFTSFTD